MKTILVIGGAGFIGSNLIHYITENDLVNEYHFVCICRNKVPQINHPHVEYIMGDYCDEVLLNSIFGKYNFDGVFHIASSSVPVTSNDTIRGDIQQDLIGTIRLLELMRRFKCNFILFFSSGGALYGNNGAPGGAKETDLCKPISSYGIIKWSIEEYIQLFHRNYGINYLILRPSNLFGEFHTSDKQGIINIAIRKAINQQPLEIWGDGQQAKDYLYIKDAVAVIYALLVNNKRNLILNLGSGQTTSINQIVEYIRELEPEIEVNYRSSVKADVRDISLNINELKRNVASLMLTDIRQGIYNTYKWERVQFLRRLPFGKVLM
ncbi:NAD-dependent epimerase/dehydratase family protein [Runella aurantiaca]|uniref:NAD-dependent epimerase/dehydratase family protein n=1 Tax=Runella aurantiaca TaxID=2282308 RepID=A0A369IAU4_9BACT|nr:NAD-dependent epimerase/dehydratase family protein [Runella aurantiaca]RDB04334.1 NAD-dependent epimerase/dehydratase family protein [Runella aurantiaca]